MAWKRYSVTIDPKVWEESQKLISEQMNVSMSRFIEIQLRSLIRSHKGSFADVVEGAFRDFVKGDKSLSEGEREKMNGLFDSEKKVKPVKKKK